MTERDLHAVANGSCGSMFIFIGNKFKYSHVAILNMSKWLMLKYMYGDIFLDLLYQRQINGEQTFVQVYLV